MSYWIYDEYGNEIYSREFHDRRYRRTSIKQQEIEKIVHKYSNNELCEKYFENSKDKEMINKIVKKKNFPAYDVAIKCYENGKMSIKQKKGLQNVLVSYLMKTT